MIELRLSECQSTLCEWPSEVTTNDLEGIYVCTSRINNNNCILRCCKDNSIMQNARCGPLIYLNIKRVHKALSCIQMYDKMSIKFYHQVNKRSLYKNISLSVIIVLLKIYSFDLTFYNVRLEFCINSLSRRLKLMHHLMTYWIYSHCYSWFYVFYNHNLLLY